MASVNGFRIVRKTYTAGALSETRHYYYSDGWRCVEERVGTSPDSEAADRQHVWGVRYIDNLLLWDRDTNAAGAFDEQLYALQDGNSNVTAVVDAAGAVQERYESDSYGATRLLAPSCAARDSRVCCI